MADICGDNRFGIIHKAKDDLLKSTNIESSPEEMAVIDNILFRCWQMGWLDMYYEPVLNEWCTDCKEYDQERHCCPRYNRVIRSAILEAEE